MYEKCGVCVVECECVVYVFDGGELFVEVVV